MDNLTGKVGTSGRTSAETVHVSAGVVERGDGHYLMSCRPPLQSSPGFWEFPGGKQEPGESCRDALVRELHEEVGIHVETAYLLVTKHIRHTCGDIMLHFWRVTRWKNEPCSLENQRLFWQDRLKPLQVSPLLRTNLSVLKILSRPHVIVVIDNEVPTKSVQDAISSLGMECHILVRQKLGHTVDLSKVGLPIIIGNKLVSGNNTTLYTWVDTSKEELDWYHAYKRWPETPDHDTCLLLTEKPKQTLTLPFGYYVPTSHVDEGTLENAWQIGAWGVHVNVFQLLL
ncbi:MULTISPECIES: NUDIX domain-containing protein [Candidatus Ichthyocystis]|uniref:NUDIX domain-containing protein n=1 Tax=Candidatus Ichthyocystis TaxID=2929841 RepID=UPI000B87CD4D|nr:MULTISPECIES: NUDIX domain-containing protein [Ichthyocystis]